ncbi:MBL fold metallo-hydrolase [Paraburkholderia sartisoli]|uniref:Uncharacterized protein n=1 Tax=Paraburkholderia sartisoli TaxID=83784 RepID=A0A1H4H6F4_9BURK|nr:hypothetical protein [Paraburkholderia sartisoli]SEB17339.1 hypothetical protein SAMN05192564_107290 [Paraburkholderia sartisoli]
MSLGEAGSGTLFSSDARYDGPLVDAIEGTDISTRMRTMPAAHATIT